MHERAIFVMTLAAWAALSLSACCCGSASDCPGGCPSGCSCDLDVIDTLAHDMHRYSCSCGSPSGPPPDTGPRPDTGPLPDSGPPPDMGPPPRPCWVDGGNNDSGFSDDDADATPPPGPGAYRIPFSPELPGGAPIELADDQLSQPVPIGFSFRFFDERHSELLVSSNGFITFDTTSAASGCCSGRAMPMPDDVNDAIAYSWTDLVPPNGGSLTQETRGVAPNRRFVLTVTDQHWYSDASELPRVSTQVILYEGTDAIEIHTTHLSAGRTYTQGVENATGCVGLTLPGRMAADFELENDGVRFVTY